MLSTRLNSKIFTPKKYHVPHEIDKACKFTKYMLVKLYLLNIQMFGFSF